MTPDERPDPLFELLADLPAFAPDEVSLRRVRMRCHAALVRQRIDANRRRRAWALLDVAAFGAMALYLAGVLAWAVRVAQLA
jgi:hypothetical protein